MTHLTLFIDSRFRLQAEEKQKSAENERVLAQEKKEEKRVIFYSFSFCGKIKMGRYFYLKNLQILASGHNLPVGKGST